MRAALSLPTDTVQVRPWPDPVLDVAGVDPRSAYVERFWLGILGPSTTWLLRRIAAGLEAEPAGFTMSLPDTARALGLGGDGRSSPFVRALARSCKFQLAMVPAPGELAVRRRLPPLTRWQVQRLPEAVQAEHQRWQEAEAGVPAVEALSRRARRLALSLVELGEDVEATERQLLRWRFHPALCREATRWAWEHHAAALAPTAADPDEPDDGPPTAA